MIIENIKKLGDSANFTTALLCLQMMGDKKMARVGFVELAKHPSGQTHDQGLMSSMLFHCV
jgi:hypothetical protein